MFFWIIVGLVLAVTLGVALYVTYDEDVVGGFLAGLATLVGSIFIGIILLGFGSLFFETPYSKVETSTKTIIPVTEESFLVQDSTHVVFREETGLTNELVFVRLENAEIETSSGVPSVETTVWEASNPWHSPFIWDKKYTYVITIPEESQ